MANTVTKLMDTDWRGQTHVTMTADTNGSGLLVVDVLVCLDGLQVHC